MPDYNLGTAHGRIKIDVDDRGAKQAEASISSFERTMQSFDRRMGTVNNSLNKLHAEMGKLRNELHKANQESEHFDNSISSLDDGFVSAARNTRNWTRDIVIMTQRMRQFIDVAERLHNPLQMMWKFRDSFNRNGGGFSGFLTALGKSGAAVAGLSAINHKLMGVDEAMKKAPMWQRSMVGFISLFQRYFAIGTFVKWITRGSISFGSFSKIADLAGKSIKTFSNSLSKFQQFGAITSRLSKVSDALQNLHRDTGNTVQGIKQLMSATVGLVIGGNVMRNTLGKVVEAYKKLGWAGKLAVMSLSALGTFGPAALELLSKGLVRVSTLLVGLADGVKQLSGGFVALPGAISMALAVASTLGVAFVGLGKKFKDIFNLDDSDAALTTLFTLPEHLRGIGNAFFDLREKIRKFQTGLQANLFQGAEGQIRNLAEGYMPLLATGMGRVANSIRNAKDRLVEFLFTNQTGKDIGRIYGSTAQTINALGDAIKPVAVGLRNVAVIGAQFLSDMAAKVPLVAAKFQAWAEVNRKNGNMMRWMQESWTGVKDLTKGMVELTKGTWKLLTLFTSNNGENFLERFANSMRKFNELVTNSAATGTLKRIADAVRNMGSEHIDNIKRALGSMFETLKAGWPIIERLVHEAGTVISIAFEHLMKTFKLFFSFFNKQQSFAAMDALKGMLGSVGHAIKSVIELAKDLATFDFSFMNFHIQLPFSDLMKSYTGAAIKGVINGFKELTSMLVPVGGLVLGVATALALIHKAMGPIKGMWKFFAGGFTVLKSLGTAIEGVVNLLYYFGFAGHFASTILGGMIELLKRFAGAIAIATMAWLAYSTAQSQIENGQKAIAGRVQDSINFMGELRKAFIADRGAIGDNVFSATENAANQMMTRLEDISNNAPGMIAHIVKFFTTGGGLMTGHRDPNQGKIRWWFSDPKEINDLQNAKEQADLAKQKFEELGLTTADIARIATSSVVSWAAQKNALEQSGEAGKAAASEIQRLRDSIDQMQTAAQGIGADGLVLIQGLDELAGAAGNADKKLQGLKHVLEGLGILKVDPLQAAFDWQEGLDNLQQGIQDIIDKNGSLSDIIDKSTGSFNTQSTAARQLFDILKPLGEQYLNTLTQQGTDPAKAYEDFAARFQAAVKTINDASQASGNGVAITEEQLKKISEAVGLFRPEELTTKINEALAGKNPDFLVKLGIDESTLKKVQETLDTIGLGGSKPSDPNNPNSDKTDGVKIKIGVDPKSNDEVIQQVQDIVTGAKDAADEKSKDLERSGFLFGEAFAKGIEDSTGKVNAAAEALVAAAIANYHQSPPKKGPLAKRGDAILYAGKVFARQYAKGISENAGAATDAASAMAGDVLNNASGAGDVSGSKLQGAGKFLGQLFDLTDIASRITNIFSQVTDIVLGFTKFVSDPMGKGTFFGKQLGFKKTVSDAELQKKRNDKLQSDFTNILDSGRRQNNYDNYGMLNVAPGSLKRDASQADIQAAIVAEGQRRGLNQEQVVAALAIAGAESQYGKLTFGKGQGAFLPNGTKGDAYGVFQQSPDAGWGTPDQLLDPNYAINKFFDKYVESLKNNKDPLAAAILTQNPQLAGNLNAGTYKNNVVAQMAEAVKAYSQALNSGSIVPTQSGMAFPGMPAMGMFPRPSILSDQGGVQSTPAAINAAGFIAALFPQVTEIGGARTANTKPNTHDKGLAIDIAIPRDKQGNLDMALGDTINAVLRQNAALLNIRYTIWRDIGQNVKDGTKFNVEPGSHQNHIDVQFNDGTVANVGPNGTKLSVPYGVPNLLQDSIFGPPIDPGTTANPPGETVQMNPDGSITRVHTGSGAPPGEPWSRATGKPWTDAERQKFFQDNLTQYNLGKMTFEQFQGLYNNPEFIAGTSQQILDGMGIADPSIAMAQAMAIDPTQYSQEQISQTLSSLDNTIASLKEQDTAGSRMQAAQLEGIQSAIMENSGFTRQQNPIDTITTLASQGFSVASDVIGTIVSGIEAAGAADSLAKQMVRGVSGTKEVAKMVDDIQKFIDLGGKIAGTVSSVSGLAATIAGAAGSGDTSGGSSAAAMALGAVSTVAGLVQAGFDTANAVIDLTQEVVRITGGYVGDFLGYLVGGPNGPLNGNIRFLLDKQTNQLLTYSADNPLDKRTHNLPFAPHDTNSRQQSIGTINVYGGPDSDPRDLTRQMMFQVNSAQYAGALSQ